MTGAPPPPARALRAADLFCGCGGFSQGAAMAGVDVVCGVELDERVIGIYRANFDHAAFQMDANDPRVAELLLDQRVDMLIGSPPCTDFSSCGPAREGDRAGLTVRFADLVLRTRPTIFVMENVPRLLNSKAFAELQSRLNGAGWSTSTLVANATWFGVAQSRARCFVVGSRDREIVERFTELVRADLKAGLSKRRTTVREVLPHAGDHVFFTPRNWFCQGVLSTDRPYPTIRANRGRCLGRPGASYKPRNDDSADVSEAYVITAADAARLASFPDDFKWPESRELVGHVIGNCVPPNMGRYVCELAVRSVEGSAPPVAGASDPGESAVNLECVPRRRSTQVGSYVHKWAGGGAKPAPRRLQSLCRSLGATISSEQYIDSAENRYVFRYTYGTTAGGDESCDAFLKWQMKPGWTLVIKERRVKRSKTDDLFFSIPGYPILFRGLRGLQRRNLL